MGWRGRDPQSGTGLRHGDARAAGGPRLRHGPPVAPAPL